MMFIVGTNPTSMAGVLASNSAVPPATPTSLTATCTAGLTIALSWTDNATDETAYRVYRSTTSGSGYAQVNGDLAAGTTSYNDTGAAADTVYYYVVRAVKNGLESASSNEANARTDAMFDHFDRLDTDIQGASPDVGSGTWEAGIGSTLNSTNSGDGSAYNSSTSAVGQHPYTLTFADMEVRALCNLRTGTTGVKRCRVRTRQVDTLNLWFSDYTKSTSTFAMILYEFTAGVQTARVTDGSPQSDHQAEMGNKHSGTDNSLLEDGAVVGTYVSSSHQSALVLGIGVSDDGSTSGATGIDYVRARRAS